MNVDIYIREKNGSREIRIPVLPEQIKYESGGVTFCTYDIMNKGEVVVPTGSGLIGISWASVFPGQNPAYASMLRGKWQDPSHYHSILEDWKKSGEQLVLVVTGYPINQDVLVENYTGEMSGAFGDIVYDLSFIEDRDIIITSTKVSSGSDGTKRSTTSTTTYTIKTGDTLWSIAQRFLGSGAKWQTIYNANKEIIELTAKKRWKAAGIDRDSENGHWIFPGTVITIPGVSETTTTTTTAPASTAPTTTDTPAPSSPADSQDESYTLSIVNQGNAAYYGTYNLYVNAVRMREGQAADFTINLNSGDRVTIVPKGTGNHGYSISESSFKMSSSKTVTITWKE